MDCKGWLKNMRVTQSRWFLTHGILKCEEGGCFRLKAAKSDMSVEEAEDRMSIQNEIQHTAATRHCRERQVVLHIPATPDGINVL